MMTTFLWIFFGGVAMSAIALVGSVTLVLREEALKKLLLPLVAFASATPSVRSTLKIELKGTPTNLLRGVFAT